MSRQTPDSQPAAIIPGEPAVAVATPEQTSSTGPSISRRLVLVFAIATGLAVANNYYAQPLLDVLARQFQTSRSVAGLIVTFTQVGYALGLVLLVPLGDLMDRRRLVVTILVGTTAALLVSGFAPTMAVLIAAAFAAGLTSVVAQILVPFSASLAPEAERGRVVGTVMSGLLLGILLARTFSGIVSQLAGWRTVYIVAALLMLALIGLLWRELPREPQRSNALTRERYLGLLHSILELIREEPLLRRRSFYGAMTFAAFSVFWTSLAFLLSRPPYQYSQSVIGLFGLLGAAGAVTASIAGRLADRGLARVATGGFLLAAALSFGLIALGGRQLIPLLLGVILLDLGAQGVHITNQSEIYRLQPQARSRLTTAYMTAYFIGGALGSASSATVYSRFGWSGVCLLGAAYLVAGLAFWLTEFAG